MPRVAAVLLQQDNRVLVAGNLQVHGERGGLSRLATVALR